LHFLFEKNRDFLDYWGVMFLVVHEVALTISTYHLHRHPSVWQNPEGFDPSRFLDKVVGQDHPFAYVPFGSGKRSCIASNFVLMEVATILALLIRKVQFTLPPHAVIQHKITTLISMRPQWDMMHVHYCHN
jgi:cytochrome P450